MCIYVITVNSSIENRCGLYEKCFTQFMKKVSSQFFFSLNFRKIFFSRGKFPEKFPPGIFGGPPGKFPEIPENPGKSRKIPGYFWGFPAGNGRYPRKIRGLFPRKRGPPEKIPGSFRKIVPPEIPEIPGNFPKFSPEFPGGVPEGVPRTFQLRIEDFLRKIWPKFGQK